MGNSVAGSPLPLTTGNENLDVAIVIHLQYCNHLIQVELLVTILNYIILADIHLSWLVLATFFLFLFLEWQLLTGRVSIWQRCGLLLKLAGQTQLLEELAEISVDQLGAITCATDGRCQQVVRVFTVQWAF